MNQGLPAHPLNRAGPMRYTRPRRAVFAFPLKHPWAWTVTDKGAPCLFMEGLRHPPDEAVGAMLALYALPQEEEGAAGWVLRATGSEAPPLGATPTGGYLAVARLAEVSTFANDSRSFSGEPWWNGASPLRGLVALWLEELTVFELLPDTEPLPLQRLNDALLLEEMRERVRLVQDGLFRHALWTPLPPKPPPPPLPQEEEEAWACACGWAGSRPDLFRLPTAALVCPACRSNSLSSPSPSALPLPTPFREAAEQASLL